MLIKLLFHLSFKELNYISPGLLLTLVFPFEFLKLLNIVKFMPLYILTIILVNFAIVLCKRRRWYKSDQHKFMSITCLFTGAARYHGHSTKIARGNFRYKRYWLLFIGSIYESLNLNCKRCPSTSLYEIRCV